MGDVDLSAALPGDYVRITTAATPSGPQTSSVNKGIYRIVRVTPSFVGGNGTVWIENDGGIEEVTQCSIGIYNGNSMVPGDIVTLNTPLWGVENQGAWIVESVGLDSGDQYTLATTFKVSTTDRTPVAQGATAALASSYTLVQDIEGVPCKFIMQITGIAPNPDNGAYMDLLWDFPIFASSISETAGSIISALDKLDFPLDLVVGADGYAYNNGLIGEANRVVYGDPVDSATYPGVAAAGAQININSALVKRIQLSLALRVRSGVANSDIANRVRSAVATVINQTGIGKPISLSSIVSAAQRVVGVIAVTVLTPSYGVGSDLITVQPSEKPLVLNLNQDIQVSFTGE
jgi:hypothetical protein